MASKEVLSKHRIEFVANNHKNRESKVFYDQGMSHDLALPYNSILTLEKQIEALIVTCCTNAFLSGQ